MRVAAARPAVESPGPAARPVVRPAAYEDHIRQQQLAATFDAPQIGGPVL